MIYGGSAHHSAQIYSITATYPRFPGCRINLFPQYVKLWLQASTVYALQLTSGRHDPLAYSAVRMLLCYIGPSASTSKTTQTDIIMLAALTKKPHGGLQDVRKTRIQADSMCFYRESA